MRRSTKLFSDNENHTVHNFVYDIHLNERSIYTKARREFLKSELVHLGFIHSQDRIHQECISDNFHVEF